MEDDCGNPSCIHKARITSLSDMMFKSCLPELSQARSHFSFGRTLLLYQKIEPSGDNRSIPFNFQLYGPSKEDWLRFKARLKLPKDNSADTEWLYGTKE